jgi:NAD(P)-dependent dehydrogenase (short-subunit alcohol dehydrogenase family)
MSLYAATYANPQGAGDARPTALQIIQDENVGGKLTGKVIVITGTSSGIGIETARALSATGATLFLTARDLDKAKTALAGILETPRVTLLEMDLTSFDSIREAAKTILSKSNGQVNILINNAGVMAVPDLQLTKDGHEMQFGTNHLSHFLLFQLLKQALLDSSTPDFHSRVVNVSSSGHRFHGLNESDNYNFEKGEYNPWTSYGQSKTANIYMANEIDRRYNSQGLHATSLQPGAILNTSLAKYMDPAMVAAFKADPVKMRRVMSPEQGAATTVLAAVSKDWENKGGKYLVNCAEAVRGEDDGNMESSTYVNYTYDPEKEARLWKDSLRIVGLTDDL